jgi:hypothetical protein
MTIKLANTGFEAVKEMVFCGETAERLKIH